MAVKFFKCNHCGNIVVKVVDHKVPVVCCGEKMTELEANTVDASAEKHVPVVTRIDDCRIKVEIGSVAHPMTPEHHIAFIYVETEHRHPGRGQSPDRRRPQHRHQQVERGGRGKREIRPKGSRRELDRVNSIFRHCEANDKRHYRSKYDGGPLRQQPPHREEHADAICQDAGGHAGLPLYLQSPAQCPRR